MLWGRVKHRLIFIFGWTNPLRTHSNPVKGIRQMKFCCQIQGCVCFGKYHSCCVWDVVVCVFSPRFLVVMVFRPTTCRAPAPSTSWQLRELKCCRHGNKAQPVSQVMSQCSLQLNELSILHTHTHTHTHTLSRSARRVRMSVVMEGMSFTHWQYSRNIRISSSTVLSEHTKVKGHNRD